MNILTKPLSFEERVYQFSQKFSDIFNRFREKGNVDPYREEEDHDEDPEKVHLREQLDEKDSELASLSIKYNQNKELFRKVSLKINSLIDDVDDPEIKNRLSQIELALKYPEGKSIHWEKVEIRFDKNHDFVDKLKQLDPKMKEATILMCTYVKMGKRNKEIANLLNVTVSAIDKKKSRLKSKFKIPKEVTFNEFILSL